MTSKSSLMSEIDSAQVQAGYVALWWIGQAGYFIKTSNGIIILVDAYLSGGSRRMMPPPLEPEEIRCDIYLATHNHLDHADYESIQKIPDGNVGTYVGPGTVVAGFRKLGIAEDKLKIVNVGDEIVLKDVAIRGTFCIPTEEAVLDSEGYLIVTKEGIGIYHTGDTGFHDFLFYLSKYTIDIMLVCINGGMGNMGIDEACRLVRLLRPRLVVPNHYGMFMENTSSPSLFRTRLMASGAEPACQILKVGEKLEYTK